ncbi:hypothetical protein MKW94_023835 [Papaver nudicaule]|uniref:Pectinesterase inhibitor domain-containing protein n=1 Tax=Papaver nudicaule TaxID=74823 RepID=A0AA41VTI5_PAPNU|nr:hypothetical protein [Papaver nudicaule]
MSPSFSFSSIFIVFLVLNFHAVNGDLISDVCNKASAAPITKSPSALAVPYDFCVASLSANPASKDADLMGLGAISLEKCAENAESVDNDISQLLRTGKAEQEAKPILHACSLYNYGPADRAVRQAMEDFKNKDYGNAEMKLKSALPAPLLCEERFTEGGVASPLTKQNGDFYRLTSISLAITDMINVTE